MRIPPAGCSFSIQLFHPARPAVGARQGTVQGDGEAPANASGYKSRPAGLNPLNHTESLRHNGRLDVLAVASRLGEREAQTF